MGCSLGSGSVARIHCEHFLEHLNYPVEAKSFLTECKRVLAPGGTLRIVVPDAEKYIIAYSHKDLNFWEQLKNLGNSSQPFSTEMEIINQSFRMSGAHCYAYDKKTLSQLLIQTGFLDVREHPFDPIHHIDQKDNWRRVESIYLIANEYP